jgi:hypothetical protein
MADHNPQHGRRQHFHRGRRGPDRRGTERRAPQREPPPETGSRDATRESGVDVEQIMRDIRARIAQRHGIDLNQQQIQELAARRLEAILEPRNVKPQLLEQLRRSAGAGPDVPGSAPLETYEFEDTTLFETHRGLLRFIRKLLNPILKLFFNPTPLVNALNTQARINKDLATRELERERRQSEWNALQYELVQRVVAETSRVSIEMQALSARVESLSARVDFNDRRVRTLESTPTAVPTRQPQRQQEPVAASTAAQPEAAVPDTAAPGESSDGTRRRRRRRRGRRSGSTFGDTAGAGNSAPAGGDDVDAADGNEDETSVTTGEPDRPLVALLPPPPTATPGRSPVIEVTESTVPPQAPSPPRDEPTPETPVDHADPGPEDR